MPPARSMKTLPSTSSRSAPSARVTQTGVQCERPLGMACSRRWCKARARGPGTAVRKRMAPISVPPDRLFVEIDVDLFDLEVFFDTPRSEFTPESGLLKASPRRFDVRGLHVVHPDDAGANFLDGAKGLENVARPNGGCQPIGRVVGDLDSVGFIVERNHGRDRAEDLFAGDASAVVYVVEDS